MTNFNNFIKASGKSINKKSNSFPYYVVIELKNSEYFLKQFLKPFTKRKNYKYRSRLRYYSVKKQFNDYYVAFKDVDDFSFFVLCNMEKIKYRGIYE